MTDAEAMDEARFQGYREGRAAVWREVLDWAAENLANAERILGHPIVTADDVRGILSPTPCPDCGHPEAHHGLASNASTGCWDERCLTKSKGRFSTKCRRGRPFPPEQRT